MMTSATSAAELVAEFRGVRRDFLALLQRMDGERLTAPLQPGGWSPREVVIHVAAWLAEANERIPAIQAGAPARTYDVDAFNAAAIAAAAGWTPERALGAFVRAAGRFEVLASELTDDDLDEEPDVRAWLESAARVMITEHIAELRAAAGAP